MVCGASQKFPALYPILFYGKCLSLVFVMLDSLLQYIQQHVCHTWTCFWRCSLVISSSLSAPHWEPCGKCCSFSEWRSGCSFISWRLITQMIRLCPPCFADLTKPDNNYSVYEVIFSIFARSTATNRKHSVKCICFYTTYKLCSSFTKLQLKYIFFY